MVPERHPLGCGVYREMGAGDQPMILVSKSLCLTIRRFKNRLPKVQHDIELKKTKSNKTNHSSSKSLFHWLYNSNMQIERKSKGTIDAQLTPVPSQLLEVDPAANTFLPLEGIVTRLKKSNFSWKQICDKLIISLGIVYTSQISSHTNPILPEHSQEQHQAK